MAYHYLGVNSHLFLCRRGCKKDSGAGWYRGDRCDPRLWWVVLIKYCYWANQRSTRWFHKGVVLPGRETGHAFQRWINPGRGMGGRQTEQPFSFHLEMINDENKTDSEAVWIAVMVWKPTWLFHCNLTISCNYLWFWSPCPQNYIIELEKVQ